jgi:hypothetical protein
MRFSHTLAALAATGTLMVASSDVRGEIPRAVQQEFRGQLLVTQGELPTDVGDAKATIAAYKKAIQSTVTHSPAGGVPTWTFHYTAFMNRAPGVTELSIDFFTDDKSRLYVANRRLMGIDPKLPILRGRLSITEDDGLLPGRDYVVQLTGRVRGKDVVFAQTKLSTK